MKPHLEHIQTTLIKKERAEKAKDVDGDYKKYRRTVDALLATGWIESVVIRELEVEKERIISDQREGDSLFKRGLENSKISCIAAINKVISELKGETNG